MSIQSFSFTVTTDSPLGDMEANETYSIFFPYVALLTFCFVDKEDCLLYVLSFGNSF